MLQPGREHPWNIRRLSHRHLHDHRNLLDLHLLTQAWVTTGAEGEETPNLTNPFAQEPTLEDDTWPEDVLFRLERGVRATQWKTLAERLEQSEKLDERSYQAGHESASRRWMQSDPSEGSIAPADKRALLMVLYHSPLGGLIGPKAFLIRRSLITEVSVELLQCPHRMVEIAKEAGGRDTASKTISSATGEVVDELCRHQFNWLRGYFSFLNPALTPVLSRPRGRCVVSW